MELSSVSELIGKKRFMLVLIDVMGTGFVTFIGGLHGIYTICR